MDKKLISLGINEKMDKAKKVVEEAIEKYGIKNIVVAWTGGKDSTVLLWIIKKVCEENGHDLPKCMFINEGFVFDEVLEFVEKLKEKWKLDVDEVKNEDVLKQVKKPGNIVKVSELNKRNNKQNHQKTQHPDPLIWHREPGPHPTQLLDYVF